MDDFERFRRWLVEDEDGLHLQENTADLYVGDVQRALEDPRGPVSFLLDEDNGLAPKTLRHFLAALRAWAIWRKDAQLTQRLGRGLSRRLPQAVTIKPKYFLAREDWHQLIREVDTAAYLKPPMRAILGFMARRGVRVGDVLRLKRATAVQALKQASFQLATKKKQFLEVDTDEVRDYLKLFVDYSGWNRVEDLVSDAEPKHRRHVATTNVQTALKRVVSEMDLDVHVHPHLLRRTVAANFLDEVGGDLNRLMDYMGWTNPVVAREYVKMRDRPQLRRAAKRMLEGV